MKTFDIRGGTFLVSKKLDGWKLYYKHPYGLFTKKGKLVKNCLLHNYFDGRTFEGLTESSQFPRRVSDISIFHLHPLDYKDREYLNKSSFYVIQETLISGSFAVINAIIDSMDDGKIEGLIFREVFEQGGIGEPEKHKYREIYEKGGLVYWKHRNTTSPERVLIS